MQSQYIMVFDIGGTWFRSAVYAPSGELQAVSKQPAYNYKNTAYQKVSELQNKLVAFLIAQVQYFHGQYLGTTIASISMGAALNGHTGEVLNSGPLWGPDCEKFDLLAALKSNMPTIEWFIINDVSAALLRYVDEKRNLGLKRLCLLTVSSGIACRTYDRDRNYFPLNTAGLQGEIGHIPIQFSISDNSLREICDCGGLNHLNAYCSGRGIENVLRDIHADYDSPMHFFENVRGGNQLALEILDALTYPIAQMLLYMLTIDAEIEKIIMTGGVIHSMETQYLKSVLKNLQAIGLYQMPSQSKFFKDILEIGNSDDNSGLLGAAKAYEHSSQAI